MHNIEKFYYDSKSYNGFFTNAAINILNRGLDESNPRETRNIVFEESRSLCL
jgi:hypothetical protein